jgi:hypothetical protein
MIPASGFPARAVHTAARGPLFAALRGCFDGDRKLFLEPGLARKLRQPHRPKRGFKLPLFLAQRCQ